MVCSIIIRCFSLVLARATNGSTTEPCLRSDDAANPARDSIINGEVRLEANGVSLDGFTVQGAPATPGVALPAGISTSPEFSGYAIRRNVVQNNPAGINLNSNGVDPTLVDHNCVRNNNVGEGADNTLPVGIFAEQGLLSNARIEANTFTGHDFGSMFLGYGLEAFPVITAPDTDLTVTHNVSVDDGVAGIIVSNVRRVEISHNTLTRTGNAVAAYAPASDVLIAHNVVEDSSFTGIRVDGDPFGCCFFPTGPTNITVAHNHVTGAGVLFPQDGIALNRTSHDTVRDNLVLPAGPYLRVEGTNGQSFRFGEGKDVRALEVREFYIATTPVTQSLWAHVMGQPPQRINYSAFDRKIGNVWVLGRKRRSLPCSSA